MDNDTIHHIDADLSEIERQQGVRVLYACESGSRAWGFASPDSDYDVRFIFAYPRQMYLQLDEARDVIERMDGDFDYAGWDIRKALRLLRNTNPALLEWLESPIVYRTDGRLRDRLAEISAAYHSPPAIHWHYLKMARGNFAQYIRNPSERGEAVLTKKYLYVANPLCKLLYYERHQALPPLDFMQALAGIDMPLEIRQAISEIVDLKRSGLELGRGPAVPALNAWLDAEMARLDAAAPQPIKYGELTDILNGVLRDVLEA